MIKTGTTFEIIAGSYRGYTGVVRSHLSSTAVFADLTHPDDPKKSVTGIVVSTINIVIDSKAKSTRWIPKRVTV